MKPGVVGLAAISSKRGTEADVSKLTTGMSLLLVSVETLGTHAEDECGITTLSNN